MELDWCAFCGKRSVDGRLFCSDACAAADAARAEAPKFDMRLVSNAMNDFAEANERHLNGANPNEPIPKLSELRKKKKGKEGENKGGGALGADVGLGAGRAVEPGGGRPDGNGGRGDVGLRVGGAPLRRASDDGFNAGDADRGDPPDRAIDAVAERERARAVDESKEFLREYQRRRTWATASTAAAADMAATAPTPGLISGSPTSTGHPARPVARSTSSSLLTAALASPRTGERPPDPPFMSMSTPVKTVELDPSVFKKRVPGGAQYNYGVDNRRYQRDTAYAEELMKESWYNQDT